MNKQNATKLQQYNNTVTTKCDQVATIAIKMTS